MQEVYKDRERTWFLVKEWETESGLMARIYRCVWSQLVTDVAPSLHPFYTGYVRLPEGDNRKYYDSDLVEVHGGITFSGKRPLGAESGTWTGFDLNHFGDEKRDEAYAAAECESLAKQIQELNSTQEIT
jgi:hypothetical protein